MKLLVNRAALVEALGLASSVVLSRTPKPVLTCVKLTAGNTGNVKTLTVAATDMELAPAIHAHAGGYRHGGRGADPGGQALRDRQQFAG